MTDAADIAREDLRSYALRRCLRFYLALLLFSIFAIVPVIQVSTEDTLAVAEAIVFGLLAAAEVASAVVMLQMVKVRDAVPGPETPLWRFALGPHLSWIAAAVYGAVAVLLAMRPT